MPSRIATIVSALMLALVFSGSAVAYGRASADDGSAVDQYQEWVPTAKKKITSGSGKKRTTTLPRKAVTGLKAVKPTIRPVIRNIATDSRYGNPDEKLAVVETPNSGGVRSSFVRSLTRLGFPGAGSSGRLATLLVAIVAVTAALAVTAVRKQRIPPRG